MAQIDNYDLFFSKMISDNITSKLFMKLTITIIITLVIIFIIFTLIILYFIKNKKQDHCINCKVENLDSSIKIDKNNTQKDYPSNFGFVEFPSELLGYNPKKFDNYAYIH
ncbi:V15 [Sputnik virophage]|uniref:Uncharacterized protein V15 n=3 Tax=Mimivirus-dependent virus Sputnik TaxID=1932927 RepID=V15_SPTNK|nr:V15 [Sputnik virophage]B4YNF5.1 RecName: Full=Uncharacterized protein V15 [Sputnik virophage]AFH75269.1 membrane protein [Sputnik virophage 2]AFH75289.1 membrane protein [Sputnik virophage 3]UMZ08527.1 Transmembrane domain-containing protein [Mimivirus-dependent virus Sputnik]ACF16999.1 V15 [Sputnik virophage]AUG85002.1 membrane protein [Sputnik virophage 2]